MGQYCTKRFKQSGVEFSPEAAAKAFKAYEKRLEEMAKLPVKSVNDQSETAEFSTYEE